MANVIANIKSNNNKHTQHISEQKLISAVERQRVENQQKAQKNENKNRANFHTKAKSGEHKQSAANKPVCSRAGGTCLNFAESQSG